MQYFIFNNSIYYNCFLKQLLKNKLKQLKYILKTSYFMFLKIKNKKQSIIVKHIFFFFLF